MYSHSGVHMLFITGNCTNIISIQVVKGLTELFCTASNHGYLMTMLQ